jgi:hypothetical protein
MEVRDWLRSRGPAEDAVGLGESEMEAADLPRLSNQYPNDLGDLPVYGEDMPASLRDLAENNCSAQPVAVPESRTHHTDEFRPLTMPLCDLVESHSEAQRDPFVDPEVEAAMRFSEAMARTHLREGGDLVDLLATFVGMIVQEDNALGLYCLEKLDGWRTMLLSERRAPSDML